MTEKNVSPKKKILKASFFVIFGYGFSQVLRLAGNLILTRLLVPENFGIMAIASVFFVGISLLTDVGLEPGVIRSTRYNDSAFLNTAWTLQVLKGPIIWFGTIILAYPVSRFYEEPLLLYLIPVVGFQSIIVSSKSTSIFMLNKNMQQGTLTVIELFSQAAGLVVMVAVAFLTRSIWSLVLSGPIAAICRTVWSHAINKNVKNRFVLEKDAVKELLSFGKWIFLSTALMFLSTQADRLILGKIFTFTFFGIYNIAVMFAELSKQIITRLSHKVIFPYLTRSSKMPRIEFRQVLQKTRRIFIFPLAVFIATLACFGDYLILFLYDPRYEQAAWILPLLAVGMWPLILVTTIDRSLLVLGKPRYIAFSNLAKFIYMIVAVPLFNHFWGAFGAVLAVALNDIPSYLIVSIGLIKERVVLFRQDVIATIFLIGVILLYLILRYILGNGIPGLGIFLKAASLG